jgi:hypothetical protein
MPIIAADSTISQSISPRPPQSVSAGDHHLAVYEHDAATVKLATRGYCAALPFSSAPIPPINVGVMLIDRRVYGRLDLIERP